MSGPTRRAAAKQLEWALAGRAVVCPVVGLATAMDHDDEDAHDPVIEEEETPDERRPPRLIAYSRHHRKVPPFTTRNIGLFALLLAFCMMVAVGLYAHVRPLSLGGLALLIGWCFCPWCALDRSPRSAGEQAPLMSGASSQQP